MHVSILDDIYEPGGAALLCSGTNTGANGTPVQFAAIGTGDAFAKGRDFAACLGLVPKQPGSLPKIRPCTS
jgi:hypothetical protein